MQITGCDFARWLRACCTVELCKTALDLRLLMEWTFAVTPGLTNFGNNERNVVGERTVTPGSHAVNDGLPHFRRCQTCRIED